MGEPAHAQIGMLVLPPTPEKGMKSDEDAVQLTEIDVSMDQSERVSTNILGTAHNSSGTRALSWNGEEPSRNQTVQNMHEHVEMEIFAPYNLEDQDGDVPINLDVCEFDAPEYLVKEDAIRKKVDICLLYMIY